MAKSEKAKADKENAGVIEGEIVDEKGGPAASEKAGGPAELEEIEENASTGAAYMPGMAPKVVKDLVNSVKAIETVLKPAFGKARDALTAEKDNLSRICHENIQFFSSPDEKGTRVYEAAGVRVEITFEKEKIKTEVKEDE